MALSEIILNPDAYLTVASILSGFGITVLMFRVERELAMRKENKVTRLAWADYLILAATSLSLIFVVLPLMLFRSLPEICITLSSASCAAAAILLAGYPFAIIDHYHIEWRKRSGHGLKGEPGERIVVGTAVALAILAFVGIFIGRAHGL
jgi:hypothetical protein